MTKPYIYTGGIYRISEALREWQSRQEPEPVLEPDLPIVDPHFHLWETPKRGRYLLHEFVADLTAGGHNVVSTVFLESDSMYRAHGPEAMRPVGEAEFVRGVAAMSASGNYGPTQIAEAMVGFADLTHGDRIREVLEAEIEAAGGLMRGVRYMVPWDKHESVGNHVVHYVRPELLLDASFRKGFAQLDPLGLSFDVWLYHHQLPEVVDLARTFPNTRIILNHVGGPPGVGPYANQQAEVLALWRKNMAEVARCPNVSVKVGGLGMLFFGFNFHLREKPPTSEDLAAVWRPYIEACIEWFGAKRSMFESNFPPDKQSCSYLTLWNAFKRVTSGASTSEKAALYSGTAREVYGL